MPQINDALKTLIAAEAKAAAAVSELPIRSADQKMSQLKLALHRLTMANAEAAAAVGIAIAESGAGKLPTQIGAGLMMHNAKQTLITALDPPAENDKN